jgi:pyruvate dehydrogenase E2 component (dihydrolipoamide acetyltransferase)
VKSDVLKAPKGAPAAGKTAPGAAGGITSLIEPALLDDRVYAPDTYELIPLDGVRKVTARRLTQSFMQVPHFPLTIDLEIDHLLSARARINEAGEKAGVKVSVNDMLIKACAMALMANPDANASYTDKGVAQHKSAHVSVAVAITGGLITPVVRDAQTKGLAQIAAEMKDLAARAREKKLKPQEYMGGTFSISNLGMMGIRQFASIINPPEGMILSVGAGEKRAVVKDDKVVVATMMTVTLTCDHRVVDGATGARWLASFKQFVETPEAMLL